MKTDKNGKFGSWEQAVQHLRSQPQSQDLVIAAYYDDPLREAADRYWYSEEWQAIKAFLPTASREKKALDVGAGRGIASYALAKEGFHVTALEPDLSSLVGSGAIRALSLEANLSIEVVQEFSEQLPFVDAQFDLVFARAMLHHARDLKTTCEELFRVLKPGGRLIAVREHVISRHEDLPAFLDSHPLHKLYGGENAFLLSEYKEAISNAGFRVGRVISPLESAINFAPYTLASLKSELAKRLSCGFPILQKLLVRLLNLSCLWSLVRPLLTHFDNRPGRLYSFIAQRP